jgi:uncharacterized protein (TIGR00725 family)
MSSKSPSRKGPLIAVYGSSSAGPHDEAYQHAERLGAELARAGARVMNGGYGGVMEACSRGAAGAGGHVIGVTVDSYARRGGPNRWVSERVRAHDLFERLRVLVGKADGFVAVGASLGTLTEVFVAWTLLATGGGEAPLVLLGSEWPALIDAHRRAGSIDARLFGWIQITQSAREAARRVLADSPPAED